MNDPPANVGRTANTGAFIPGPRLLSPAQLPPTNQVYSATRYGVDVTRFPRCVEVAARAGELPAFVAAHPDQQPDAPQKVTS